MFFFKFANYEAFKGVFLSFKSHFLAFQACSPSLLRIYRKIGLRLLEGVFLMFSPYLLPSVLYVVCVSLSIIGYCA